MPDKRKNLPLTDPPPRHFQALDSVPGYSVASIIRMAINIRLILFHAMCSENWIKIKAISCHPKEHSHQGSEVAILRSRHGKQRQEEKQSSQDPVRWIEAGTKAGEGKESPKVKRLECVFPSSCLYQLMLLIPLLADTILNGRTSSSSSSSLQFVAIVIVSSSILDSQVIFNHVAP